MLLWYGNIPAVHFSRVWFSGPVTVKRDQSVTVTGATPAGLANVSLGLWEQERTGCLRPSQSLSGVLLTLWHVCQTPVLAGTPQGTPSTPSWLYMGNCFGAWTAKLWLLLLPPHCLCQWTFCWGGYMLVRAILMNLNLFLYSVFLFFQKVELAWGSSISHFEDG